MVTIERSERSDRIDRRDEATFLVLDAGRRARRDALPEHTQYADTGCDVHPSCLSCPLVRCRYDEPGGARKLFNDDRDRAIAGMQSEGASIDAIAQRFGVSRRTVFRALAKGRNPSRVEDPSPLTPSPLAERGSKTQGLREGHARRSA